MVRALRGPLYVQIVRGCVGGAASIARKVNGESFKPSTLRGYQQTMDDHVLPELGSERLSAIRRRDLQRLVNEMLAAGKDASTIRNTIAPVRVLYRQAVDDIPVNPTARLQLPSSAGVTESPLQRKRLN